MYFKNKEKERREKDTLFQWWEDQVDTDLSTPLPNACLVSYINVVKKLERKKRRKYKEEDRKGGGEEKDNIITSVDYALPTRTSKKHCGPQDVASIVRPNL